MNESRYRTAKTAIREWLRRDSRLHSVQDVREAGASLGTSVGEVRSENQDRAAVAHLFPGKELPPRFVAVVCDGIGGLMNGSECAEVAVAALMSHLIADTSREDLGWLVTQAVQAANRAVHDEFEGRGGTTMAGVVSCAGSAVGFSVGDSRLYVWRRKQLAQVSMDDTIAGEVSRITGEEVPEGVMEPFSQYLAQYVGIGEGLRCRLYPLTLSNNEWYVLTTDGAHSAPNALLSTIVSTADQANAIVMRLVQFSRWRGGRDNATVICGSIPIWSSAHVSPVPRAEMWSPASKLDLAFVIEERLRDDVSHASPPVAPKAIVQPRRSKPKKVSKTPRKRSDERKSTMGRTRQTRLEIQIDDGTNDQPSTDPDEQSPAT